MRRIKMCRLWQAICVVLLIQNFVGSSGLADDTDNIVLTISSAKNQYLLAEPVGVRVSLSNSSAMATSVIYVVFGLGKGGGDTYQTSEDGKTFENVRALKYADFPPKRVVLAPGGVIYHEQTLIYCGARGLLFPRAGDYSVRVRWRSKTSNVLKITVREPDRPADIEACELMRLEDVLRQYLGVRSEDASRKLRQVAEATSAYTPYGAFYVSAYIEHDDQLALKFLDKADVEGFPLQSAVVMCKGRKLLEMKQHEKAWGQFERVRREFPNSPAAAQILDSKEVMNFTREEAQELDRQQAKSEEAKKKVAEAKKAFVESGERAEVEKTVRKFLKAYEAKDVGQCARMMTKDFVLDEVFSREEAIQELKEGLKELGDIKLKITLTISSIELEGNEVKVTMEVTYSAPGKKAGGKEELSLRKDDKTWLILRWTQQW